jgi:AcrR family transcriptional regulator
MDPEDSLPGLRDRKKAQRREVILRGAERLFVAKGIDATTVAMIANEVGVSTPTIFNYFGTKNNILAALIFEGAAKARATNKLFPRRTNGSFAQAVTELLSWITENTIKIAGKRIWRYAEATNIRRPNSEFEQQFAIVDRALVHEISKFISDYNVKLLNGSETDDAFLARLLFDRWSVRYLEFIKEDSMSLEDHAKVLEQDIDKLLNLILDATFARNPTLKCSNH